MSREHQNYFQRNCPSLSKQLRRRSSTERCPLNIPKEGNRMVLNQVNVPAIQTDHVCRSSDLKTFHRASCEQ
jgi:hypothetical protein